MGWSGIDRSEPRSAQCAPLGLIAPEHRIRKLPGDRALAEVAAAQHPAFSIRLRPCDAPASRTSEGKRLTRCLHHSNSQALPRCAGSAAPLVRDACASGPEICADKFRAAFCLVVNAVNLSQMRGYFAWSMIIFCNSIDERQKFLFFLSDGASKWFSSSLCVECHEFGNEF